MGPFFKHIDTTTTLSSYATLSYQPFCHFLCPFLILSCVLFSFFLAISLLPALYFSPLRPQTAAKKVWRSCSISMITLPKNVNGWKSGNISQPRIEAWHYGHPKSSGCVWWLATPAQSEAGEECKSAVKSEAPPADWCIIECLFQIFLKARALIILILSYDSGFWSNQKNLCPVRVAHQRQRA